MIGQFIEIPGSIALYPVGLNALENKNSTDLLAKYLLKHLKDNKILNEDIVLIATGSSGVIISAFLSIHLPGCKILHIKKDNENSHSHHSNQWLPNKDSCTLIFVDDFQERGNTYKKVYKEVLDIFSRPLDIACFLGGISEKHFIEHPINIVFAGYKNQ